MKFTSTAAVLLAAAFALPGYSKSESPAQKSAAAPLPSATSAITADDAAHFLAGLPVSGPLEPLTHTAAWRAHAAELDAAWQRMDTRQLAKVRAWAHGLPEPKSLFYFFSGPDFLYADQLFPAAKNYILCAIEPIGGVGDFQTLDEARLAASLANLRQSMSSMLKFHYFITKEMRADFVRDQLSGTLPILYVFLARTGHTIRSVTPVADGVKIDFSGGPAGRKTLHYFRTDLANGANNAAFFDFCRQYRGAGALLKSASYLLHEPGFSKCRDFLLQNTSAILEDDSGIPFRDLTSKDWSTRLFGSYRGTEGTFAKYSQPDLLAAFRAEPPGPLGFAFGYQAQSEKACLILATKR